MFKTGEAVEHMIQTRSVSRWALGVVLRALPAYSMLTENVYEIEFTINKLPVIRLRYESEIRLAQSPLSQAYNPPVTPQPSPWAQFVNAAANTAALKKAQGPQARALGILGDFVEDSSCLHDWKERILFTSTELYCTKCPVYKSK